MTLFIAICIQNMTLTKLGPPNYMYLQYLAFPCGLIRGALSNFGITSVVTVDINTMPCCEFVAKINCFYKSSKSPSSLQANFKFKFKGDFCHIKKLTVQILCSFG